MWLVVQRISKTSEGSVSNDYWLPVLGQFTHNVWYHCFCVHHFLPKISFLLLFWGASFTWVNQSINLATETPLPTLEYDGRLLACILKIKSDSIEADRCSPLITSCCSLSKSSLWLPGAFFPIYIFQWKYSNSSGDWRKSHYVFLKYLFPGWNP